MSEEERGCQKPDQLKGKPEECPPEQIKKCHGDIRGHPCVSNNPDKKGKE